LDAYAKAAAAMEPPRKALTWKDVVNMTTLADFDLLRDGKTSILNQSWTDPKTRAAMSLHFRLKRAREEVHRLNIEIRRQTTYMEDEYITYAQTICHLQREESHDLAHYVAKEAVYKSVMFSNVMYFLLKAARLPGFSGTLRPGVRKGATKMVLPLGTIIPEWLSHLQGDGAMAMEVDTDNRLDETEVDDEAESAVLVDYAEHLSLE
jgi:hypothetical protein